ncbi:hypothetical protein A2Z10_01045 [Candidatus Azambacteria bacterium RBG_16_47_10]|uniref:Putative 3-methyladenine DNA glycosylase n=1 Tax=Candidatus Azambacteria bacterium RBG_16_47_10 TaxID=1797292 RepID=A0A1F5AZ92_9BACT|nr:MAG: hypothetical protein A2Z10_01045 [Candidatus Azambacteria bacterium RBG_16_47_10]
MQKLPQSFFQRPTLVVARDLLGKYLVVKNGNSVLSGKIVETEAYRGEDDLACHASKGRTPRTETLYAEAGTIYVYLIYGMYHCLNIVTEEKDFPSAVLVRAVEPIEGIHTMEKRRKTKHSRALASGPGKLCDAFGITKRMNGKTVFGDTVLIEDRGDVVKRNDIVTVPRVGVDYAGACTHLPWRFYIKKSGYISRK